MRPLLITAVVLAACAAGCAPRIGDGCSISTNCSINNDRVCDTSQPGGACTIFDCQADRCPDDAVCVRFNPVPARRTVVACMRRCASDGDCRDGYACVSVPGLAEEDLLAEVLDSEGDAALFCVATDRN